MIPQVRLNELVCPVCKNKVIVTAGGHALRCPECQRVYPVREGIPVMLIDHAVTDAPEP